MRSIISQLFACALLCLLWVPAVHAQNAGFKHMTNDRASLSKLKRLCQVTSNNEVYDVQMLAGVLLQTRFKGPKVKTCISSPEQPCARKPWYPQEFMGVLHHTNRHPQTQKVFFKVQGFAKPELHRLDFKVGHLYAFCGQLQEQASPHYPPTYVIHSYHSIVELQ